MTQINTKEIYKFHMDKTYVQLITFEKELLGYKIGKSKLITLLSNHKQVIDKCCNMKYEDIINIKNIYELNRLDFNLAKINIFQENVNPSTIKSLASLILEVNKNIKDKEAKVLFLQNNSLAYVVYKQIIDSFNVRIIDKILEGYSFTMGYGLSDLKIRKKKRTKANIDWGKSNALKELILSRGGTPYNKETAPHGENWFVYFTSDYEYWWFWAKPQASAIPNYTLYAFTPSNGINGAKAKLRNLLKKNDFAKLNFSQ